MMKQSVVLFPGVGTGHINPMIELAKLFIADGLSVTILVLESPFSPSSTASFLSRASAANPSISFHLLPDVPLPPNPPITALFDLFRLITPHILDLFKSLSQTSLIRAFILDYLCAEPIDAAAELRIPTYFFCATSASNLIALVLAPSLHDKFTASFKDLGETPIEFPGVPPIPASHMLGPLMSRDDPFYDIFIYRLKRLQEAAGILVNTFEQLEPRAAEVLAGGLDVPGATMPPVYCIGPVSDDAKGGLGEERHECLTWLDAQPEASVVFVCFGSMGSPSGEQLKEIAVGLEQSGQRFLWTVRTPPPSEDRNKFFNPRPEPDLDALMPEGFLERTEGRGMVLKSWAPQVAVLRHEAVGAFVSHCGWNSTLESIAAGVPIISWPMYAEQRMTRVFLVEEAKIAVAMDGYDKGMVTAEEVERKVRLVLEDEGGKELRRRAKAMKEAAATAKEEGGSSHKAWLEFMGVIKSAD